MWSQAGLLRVAFLLATDLIHASRLVLTLWARCAQDIGFGTRGRRCGLPLRERRGMWLCGCGECACSRGRVFSLSRLGVSANGAALEGIYHLRTPQTKW